MATKPVIFVSPMARTKGSIPEAIQKTRDMRQTDPEEFIHTQARTLGRQTFGMMTGSDYGSLSEREKRRADAMLEAMGPELEDMLRSHPLMQMQMMQLGMRGAAKDLAGRLAKGEIIPSLPRNKRGFVLPTGLGASLSEIHYTTRLAQDEERLDVIRTLKKHGYDVRLLAPSDAETQVGLKFMKEVRGLGVPVVKYGAVPGRMEVGGMAMPLPPSPFTDYCRDTITQVGSRFYVNPFRPDFYLERIGVKAGHCISPLAEGGMIVQGEDFILASAELKPEHCRELEKSGKKVYPMPRGEVELQVKLGPKKNLHLPGGRKLYMEHPHIDLSMNYVPGSKVMAVNQTYYENPKAKKAVDRVVKEQGLKLVIVPHAEEGHFAVNFLALPGGKALLNKASVKTAKRLEKNGVEVITTEKPVGNWGTLGSIRCITNVFHV